MSEEIKNEIITAWNRYLASHSRRCNKNEGSIIQHEEHVRVFHTGIKNHAKLSKKEKDEKKAEEKKEKDEGGGLVIE